MNLTIENIISKNKDDFQIKNNSKKVNMDVLEESVPPAEKIQYVKNLFQEYAKKLNDNETDEKIKKDMFIFEMMLVMYSEITGKESFKIGAVFDVIEGHYEFLEDKMSHEDFISYNLLFGDQKKIAFNEELKKYATNPHIVGHHNVLFKIKNKTCTLLENYNMDKTQILFDAYKEAETILEYQHSKKRSIKLITDLLEDEKLNNKPIEKVIITTVNRTKYIFRIDNVPNIEAFIQKFCPSTLSTEYDTFPLTKYANERKKEVKKQIFDFEKGFKLMKSANPEFQLDGISVKQIVGKSIGGTVKELDLNGTKHLLGKTGSGKSRVTHILNQDFASEGAKIVYLTSEKQEATELAYQTYRESNGTIKPLVMHSIKNDFENYYQSIHDFKTAKLKELYKNREYTEEERMQEKEQIEEALDFISAPYEPDSAELLVNLLMKAKYDESGTKKINFDDSKERFFVNLKALIDGIEIYFKDSKKNSKAQVLPVLYKNNASKMFNQIPTSDVIFVNYSAFMKTKVPFQYDFSQRTLYEYFSETADLIVIDEADKMMQNFDQMFNSETPLLSSQHDVSTLIDLAMAVISQKNKETNKRENISNINKLYDLSRFSNTEFFKVLDKKNSQQFFGKSGNLFDLYTMINHFFYQYTKKNEEENPALNSYFKMFFSKEKKANYEEVEIYYKEEIEELIGKYDDIRLEASEYFKAIYNCRNEEGEILDIEEYEETQEKASETILKFLEKLVENKDIILKKKYEDMTAATDFLTQLMYFSFYDNGLREIYVYILSMLENEAKWLKKDEEIKRNAEKLANKATNNSNLIRNYIPKSVLNSRMNYKYEEEKNKKEYTVNGKKTNRKVKLLVNSFAGRELMFNLYGLFYRTNRKTLPNVLLMSATSYLEGSTKNHIDIPASYLVQNEYQQEDNIQVHYEPIGIVSEVIKNIDKKNQVYRISGTPSIEDEDTNENLLSLKMRELAKDMYSNSLVFEESFKNLERMKITYGYGRRQIIGIVCSSYETTEKYYNGLKNAMEKDKMKNNFSCYYLGEDKGNSGIKEGLITKNELSELGEKDIDVLVFPQSVLSRGKNILIPGEKNSLIGEMYIISRSMPIPDDFNNAISYVHSKMKKIYEKASKVSAEKNITAFQMMKKMIDSEMKYKNIADSRFDYIDEESQKAIAYNTLCELMQVFGRGMRGGTELHIRLIDSAFVTENSPKGGEKLKTVLDYWSELSEEGGLTEALFGHVLKPMKKLNEESKKQKEDMEEPVGFTF